MEIKDLYYEVRATLASEVEAAYEYAKTHNIKFYRATTESGKIFGWKDGHHVVATDGQEWFENPDYEESEKQTESVTTSTETLELSADDLEEVDIHNDNIMQSTENVAAFEKDARIAELERLIAEKSELLEIREREFAELKSAIKIIANFIEEV